jgi:hypothetical protein
MIQSSVRPVFDEMNRIDHINDQAHKLGMSYRDLNTIQLALGESAGVEAEDISKAMQKLSIGVTEAITSGKGAHADALKTLGLSASDIGGMNGVAQLEKITNAMVKIDSQAERLRLTFDLFGKTGSQLVAGFDEGGGKLAEMARYADEVGLNLSGPVVEGINNANDSLGRLKMATQGWLAQLTGGAAPALGVMADHMANAAKAGEGPAKLGEQGADWVQGMYGVINDFHQIMSKPMGEIKMSDFGKTQRDLTWKTLAAQGRAEEQAKEKEQQAHQIKERVGMEEDLEQKKRDTEREDAKWLHDYEADMTSRNQSMKEAESKRALENEYKTRQEHIEKMRQKKIAGDDKFGDQVTDRTAPALRAGSVEAYKFLLAQRDSLAEKQARQEELAEEANTIAREQLEELRQQPRFAARGGK